MRQRHAVAMAQGAVVVVAAYVLIGAGIGFAAGSVLVGIGAGLLAGLCAVAAILLVRGSAVASGTATDSVRDDHMPVASPN